MNKAGNLRGRARTEGLKEGILSRGRLDRIGKGRERLKDHRGLREKVRGPIDVGRKKGFSTTTRTTKGL